MRLSVHPLSIHVDLLSLVLAGSFNPEILTPESCFLQTINQKVPINTLKVIHTSNNNKSQWFGAFHTMANPGFCHFKPFVKALGKEYEYSLLKPAPDQG